MPFVDLSQLLSPQIPPLFQDAGISPVWVRQELPEVGPLQASLSPSFLPSSSQLWWSRQPWLQGQLGIFQGSRPGFDSPWQSGCHPCCWPFRILLLFLLFSTPLQSTANWCRTFQSYWCHSWLCWKYIFWLSSFSSIWRCLFSVSVPPIFGLFVALLDHITQFHKALG